MKKIIGILSIVTVIGVAGCSKADIEKEPVVIEDAASLDEEVPLETPGEVIPPDEDREEDKVDNWGEEESAPITIEIEGMEETINGLQHIGDRYQIIYDADRFEYSKKEEGDTFIAENPDPAIYPYVYLSINYLENKSASDYIGELSDLLSKDGLETEIAADAPIGNYKGSIVTARSGSEWNSIIRNYYIIENGTGLYIIESQYFLEAAEGYGARIHAMLSTFEIK